MNAIERAVDELIRTSQVMEKVSDVYYGVGEPDSQFPFVVFFKQPRLDSDRYSLAARSHRLQRYVVKVVDIGPSKRRVQEIVDDLDDLLTDSRLPLTEGEWLHCHRVGEVEYQEELPDGRTAWHVGGVYEITVGV